MRVLRTRRRVSVLAAVLLVALLVGAALAAAAAYDHGRRDRLAPGVTIGGVEVGDMQVAAARERLQRALVEPRRRDLRVQAAGHTFRLTAARRTHVPPDRRP